MFDLLLLCIYGVLILVRSSRIFFLWLGEGCICCCIGASSQRSCILHGLLRILGSVSLLGSSSIQCSFLGMSCGGGRIGFPIYAPASRYYPESVIMCLGRLLCWRLYFLVLLVMSVLSYSRSFCSFMIMTCSQNSFIALHWSFSPDSAVIIVSWLKFLPITDERFLRCVSNAKYSNSTCVELSGRTLHSGQMSLFVAPIFFR